MSVAISATYIKADGQYLRIGGNLVFSGSYTTSQNGDVVDFTKLTQDALFQGMGAYLPASLAPVNFDVWDVGGNTVQSVQAVLGTTQSNCRAKFITAFNTELGTGAYPAGITGSKYNFEAVFMKNI